MVEKRMLEKKAKRKQVPKAPYSFKCLFYWCDLLKFNFTQY